MSNVLLLGDQTADQQSLLRKLVLRRKNALLTTFHEQVSVVLREETSKLPAQQRKQIPNFLALNTLVEAYYTGSARLPILESTFVALTQLSHHIAYFSENPDKLPNAVNTRVLGLCTGALAAAAIVSAKSLSELVPLAVEAVRVAFRAGACVAAAKQVLQQPGDENEPWSSIVMNVSEKDAEKALDDYHISAGISAPNRAYISAVSTMAVTISGPPSTTTKLFAESQDLNMKNRVSIPIYAPYHAGHLNTDRHLEKIIPESTKNMLKQHRPMMLMHSSSSGQAFVAENAYDLMSMALVDFLQQPVRWDKLLEECISQIIANPKAPAKIFTLGICNMANSIASALKAGGQATVSVTDHTTWEAPENFQSTKGRTQNDKIAIVGLSGRFPSAASVDALWELLEQGLDVHRKVPADRFDADAHCDPSGKGKNKSHTPFGCFIDEPGLFDPRFFNMSPREAAQTDPMGRLALVTAYEALEQSGYVPNRTPSTKLNRIGTFYGQTSDDWREINAAENVDTYFITGGVRAFAPGRINYYFKFSGPSFSVDTACSSSLAAIQLACTSLWAGDCDTACAGGLNVLTNPDIFSGLSKGQFLSKTGSCKTYDNDADGYCRGDGCGSVILKRYEDAVADKDNILGCILGAATNHSAEAVSITHPHAGNQEFLFKKVLADAGIDAHEISYVEMHGTGTQAGDGIEMTSVTNTFAPPHRRRTPDEKLFLGAIKANVGHGEAASGINSLAKVLMMLKKNAIPANVGIKGVMNKTFPKDLGERNVNIPLKHTEWPRNGAAPRRLFLNNFSAAGGNTSLLIEDAPLKQAPTVQDPRSTLPVTVTARSIASLKRNIDSIKSFLKKTPDATMTSLSYSLTARRIQHNYRIAFAIGDINKVSEALDGQIKDTYSPVPITATKTAFCFTGQGSQYTGLGQKLYQDLPSFKTDIDQLDQLAQTHGLPSFLELLDGTDVSTLSPVKVQLGMACIQVALARMWESWGVTPTAVIGHSLGEYAALHVAGVISASDMVYLVGRRAELLVKDCTPHTHGMLAVKGSVDAIESALGSKMTEVACINGPEETVLCGSAEVVTAANDVLTGKGMKATKLNVPFAFHSAQVEPILESFKQAAKPVTFNKPSVPVLSPLTGDVITEAGVIGPDYLAKHARETVNFTQALESGEKSKAFDQKTAWVEIGAHPVCLSMVKNSVETNATAPSLRRNEDAWKTIASSVCALFLAGVYVNFDEYHRAFNDAQVMLDLPTYSFDDKKYWLDYHNNWTLTKGEAPVPTKAIEAAPAEPAAPVERTYKKLSDSCQKVVEEEFWANAGRVVIQSDVCQPNLRKVAMGHQVNDTALCPSSLYFDMAMTVSDYIYKALRPSAPQIGYNVAHMEVPKPFIIKNVAPPEGQHLQLEAQADLEEGTAKLSFRSVTPDGKKLVDHAHCTVKFEDINSWQESWDNISFMVKSQIENLQRKTKTQEAHVIGRGLAYKLFKVFVNYADQYRGMEEIILDNKSTEATASIHFQTKPEDGEFFFPAYWCDSMAHLGGFIVNATDLCDSDNFVSVSHGWGSIKVAKPMSADKKYRNYVRMLEKPGNVTQGDVYIFDGDEIVAVVGALKFQKIPRKVLNTFLPPQKAGSPASAPAAAPAAARPALKQAPPAIQTQVKPASAPKQVAMAAPAPKAAAPKKADLKKPAGPTIVTRVMQIIATETDVDSSELVEQAAFENLGVDSLMSLTISARFREELDMDISSTLFTDYPTVGEMRKYFSQFDGNVATPEQEDSDSDSETSGDASTPMSEVGTPMTVPSSAVSDSGKFDLDAKMQTSGEASPARKIIAQEMGVDVAEITDQADLADMGMDSLMSLAVLGELRELTGLDLASTFLMTNPTIEDIENALDMRPKPSAAPVAVPSKPATSNRRASSPQLDKVNEKLNASRNADISKFPPATSVLLQGNPKVATKKIFFLPDGSGSATSYVSIPNLGTDVCAFGLNCPFMKNPESWQCGIEIVAMVYLAEIKRRQPQGPYIIGGWSAGGVIAYAVSQALLANGEAVDRLLLLDSPCPVNLDPLPARLHIFFNEIGLLGTGDPTKTPKWLLPHFTAAIRSLSDYQPQRTIKPVKTYAIWCREGVAGNPGDPRPPPAEDEDPAPMKWLLNHRTDFGSNGWEQLCGEENMKYGVMDGHHFSMMKPPHADALGNLIKEGLNISEQQQEPAKDGSTNPRGIPYAPFVDQVEDYVSGREDVESTLKSFSEMISKYQFMESNTQRRMAGLKDKIPEIKKTLEMVRFLKSREEDDDPLETHFELNDTLYAKALVPTTKEVYLWLGANVMLSYPVEEAEELLTSKLNAANTSLEHCDEDLDFLREQITTLEVATARVYNWDVGQRRKEREQGKGSKEELESGKPG
ncbi:polyketide synthase-like protein [Elsinoe australis]|uniref:Polyketide synthase-like protein n=2 Tax=Elsinoe australis TaxID=40998 RepID=A0A4U7B1M3_9PEZI|nr:polyketide synthase-like protein [Elsinoe australis]